MEYKHEQDIATAHLPYCCCNMIDIGRIFNNVTLATFPPPLNNSLKQILRIKHYFLSLRRNQGWSQDFQFGLVESQNWEGISGLLHGFNWFFTVKYLKLGCCRGLGSRGEGLAESLDEKQGNSVHGISNLQLGNFNARLSPYEHRNNHAAEYYLSFGSISFQNLGYLFQQLNIIRKLLRE